MLLEEERFCLCVCVESAGSTLPSVGMIHFHLKHGGKCVNNALFCGAILRNIDFSYIKIIIYP